MFQLASFKPFCCHLYNCYLLLLLRRLDPCVRLGFCDFVRSDGAAFEVAVVNPVHGTNVPLLGYLLIVWVSGGSRLPGVCTVVGCW
jgi:hypothetical protein